MPKTHGGRLPRPSRARQLVGSAALLVAAACSSELGPPRPQPLPSPDPGGALSVPGPLSPRTASYRIDAHYDAEAHRITATETLTWIHRGTDPVDELPLHLYLNAFKNEESLFMRESRGTFRRSSAADDSWGWIDLERVTIGGVDRTAALRYPGMASAPAEPSDETVVVVPLETPLSPGQSVTVEMSFVAKLPAVFARTGHAGDFALVAQWFPKIAVRTGAPGEERWHAEPFHANSEFFADFGTYDVTLHVPRTHVVAATGVLVSARDDGDTRTLVYRAEDVHDFAWMIDPYMQVMRGTAEVEHGEVEVRVYHRPAQRAFAERHLAAAVAAIEVYSELYLPYPWPIMSVVDPPPGAEGAGGMEYPTFVTTAADSALTPPGVRFPEFVTLHEVGHGWFQGILASNEVDEAWLDEGINEYSNGVAFAEMYAGAPLLRFAGIELGLEGSRKLALRFASVPDPIAIPAADFVDASSYGAATYAKTALVFSTLENVVGRDRFRAAMKTYARRFAFRHPSERDLIDTLEGELGEDLDWFLGPALHEIGGVELRVRGIDCRRARPAAGVFGRGDQRVVAGEKESDPPWRCQVTVENLGRVPCPVDLELVFGDGERERVRWDDRGDGPRWHRFTVERASRVVEAILDPDGKVLLDLGGPDSSLRVEPDRDTARRAGAAAQFLSHSVMQAVGL